MDRDPWRVGTRERLLAFRREKNRLEEAVEVATAVNEEMIGLPMFPDANDLLHPVEPLVPGASQNR